MLQNLLQKLRRLRSLQLNRDVELRVALEFGVVLSETANARAVELTEKIVVRAEKILLKELKDNGVNKTSINFTPLVMAVLEVK